MGYFWMDGGSEEEEPHFGEPNKNINSQNKRLKGKVGTRYGPLFMFRTQNDHQSAIKRIFCKLQCS